MQEVDHARSSRFMHYPGYKKWWETILEWSFGRVWNFLLRQNYMNQSFLIFLVGSMSSKVTPAILIVLYSLMFLRSAIYLLIKFSCPFIIDNFSFVFSSLVLSDNRST